MAAVVFAFCPTALGLALDLQTRDPATGAARSQTEEVDPRRVGVIGVDVRNFPWCTTATMRMHAVSPRLDRALNAARELGMTVMLCPSDVVDNYVGFPQRKAVLPSLSDRAPERSGSQGSRLFPANDQFAPTTAGLTPCPAKPASPCPEAATQRTVRTGQPAQSDALGPAVSTQLDRGKSP